MTAHTKPSILVLDTSILVHNPLCIEGFPDSTLYIPIWVVRELDHLKGSGGERGQNALQALRNIHDYSMTPGFAADGVRTQSGSLLKAATEVDVEQGTDLGVSSRNIAFAKRLATKHPNSSVVILSKDIERRIHASMAGVASGDYEPENATRDPYEMFPGCLEIAVNHTSLFTELHRTGFLHVDTVDANSAEGVRGLIPNQCVRFVCDDNGSLKDALAIYKLNRNGFRLVSKPKVNGQRDPGVGPKNCEQAFAYALLTDPEISLVSLVGSAGSGKTLLSLLAAKDHLATEFDRPGRKSAHDTTIATCDQIMVFRPNVEMGHPLGFLPGDLEEKFAPWMYPILDNLELILGKSERTTQKEVNYVDEFLADGSLVIMPINHVRGRSLHNKFVILDEAQNLTPLEVRSLITRAGQGTKVVLTGDTSQIDHPYLDSVSNGLSHVIRNMTGQNMFGYTIMTRGEERSLLAKMAAELL